ncbi:MAG TPA: LysM peptidoglycan-binding domain-containing protein, partial [Polyangiaceae bacterium]
LTRLGDTVDAIATSRGTTKSRLLELNALRPEELVRPGTVLVLPAADGARPLREALKRELGKDEEKPIVPILADVPQLPGRKRVFYRVTTGDTVAEIAAAFRVTPDDLRRWNSLDPAARMHEGMTLLILADEATDLSKVAHLTEAEVRCITVGSEEFFTYFEGLRGRKRTTVVVGDGDTWEKLAKRYNLTLGQLERINHRSRTDKLTAKETLIVYAPAGKPVPSSSHVLSSPSLAPLGTVAAPNPEDLPAAPDGAAGGDPSIPTRAEPPSIQ